MTLWDGLTSSNALGLPDRIMILGATNRMQDIDEAILRRMPKKFAVSLPSVSQRKRILNLILKGTKIDEDHFDADYLAKVMAGMSGSDIKEACRDAAMAPVREFIRTQRSSGVEMSGVRSESVRGVRTEDFFGRKGNGQSMEKNHAKRSSKRVSQISEVVSDDDQYEDIIDEQPIVD